MQSSAVGTPFTPSAPSRAPMRFARRIARSALALPVGALVWLACFLLMERPVHAIGDHTAVELRQLDYAGGHADPRPNATKRLAWEVRQRTSVETRLESTHVRFSDATVYDSPLLYFSGDRPFPPFSEAEVQGFRRFVDFGGFVIIDDASPEESGFDGSVRREVTRAFGPRGLARLDTKHVLYRSFYLVPRPLGRVEGVDYLEGVERAGRLAVVYSRHDLGGAY
ncbi:MAG: DUF4159 domain-containing protein, partial [Polyangiales bacterium]